MKLTATSVRELLDYNPETGIFRWKVSRGRVKKGDIAGTVGAYGYILIRVYGIQHKAHRLAWLITYGKIPKGGLDHRDRITSHNWITNLRKATQQENTRNRKSEGVSWHKRNKRWRAYIVISGKHIHLGYSKNLQQAKDLRVRAARAAYGEFMPLAK